MFRLTAASLLILGFTALPVRAADGDADSNVNLSRVVITAPDVDAKRPAALPALYVTLAGLQAYDVYSTRQGLSQGAREINPLMQGVVGSSTATIVTKAVSTTVTILIAEKLWRTNKTAAIITMVVANGVMGMVAANNARVLQQTR